MSPAGLHPETLFALAPAVLLKVHKLRGVQEAVHMCLFDPTDLHAVLQVLWMASAT